jgi:4-hydroxythreonine-4-phosphate dehydrogenase
VRTAFAEGRRIVVADATTDDDLDRHAAHVAAHPEVVLVGPAAVVTALARRVRTGADHPRASPGAPLAGGNVLVVSASQHPSAMAQFAALRELGDARVTVVRPPADADPSDPDGVLAALAAEAHRRLATDASIATVVVVGGDTAAAVLGAAAVTVHGTLGVGIALGRTVLGGREVRLVTKPGGFGGAGTLVDVLEGLIDR